MTTIYQEVTNSIIEQLEKGAAPWIKPWSADSTADKNIVSQKPYAGINRLILGMSSMCQSFNTPVWGSFKQWQALGASVKKGEKGTKIIFYSPVTKENKATGGSETYNLIKAYFVFNAGHLETLADDMGVDLDTVFTLAGILGSSEDFDGLITSLEDFSAANDFNNFNSFFTG